MAVDELPVAVNAPVDVGNPQGHVTRRAAVDADVAAFQARGVGQIPAGGDGEVLQAHGAWMPVSCARVLRNASSAMSKPPFRSGPGMARGQDSMVGPGGA